MRPLIWLMFSLVACFLISLRANAETYTHDLTGLKFQDSVAGMMMTKVTNFENVKPGLGISVDYRADGRKLTIFIYNLRRKKFLMTLPIRT